MVLRQFVLIYQYYSNTVQKIQNELLFIHWHKSAFKLF